MTNETNVDESGRYWLSWVQPTEDYRPLEFPPHFHVIGWWKSGECEQGSILCALVYAHCKAEAMKLIHAEWPEAKDWRFVERQGSDWTPPQDRFPLGGWMRERLFPNFGEPTP